MGMSKVETDVLHIVTRSAFMASVWNPTNASVKKISVDQHAIKLVQTIALALTVSTGVSV